MCRHCQIIPGKVLKRLSDDANLSIELREALANTLKLDEALRRLRRQAGNVTAVSRVALLTKLAAPAIAVFDCQHSQTLPGISVPAPESSADGTAKNVATTTAGVAEFYKTAFGRNSIDGAGMTLLSSIHYGEKYNNAFWNGSQMAYGDGDGSLFVDFSAGNDVVAHELTHGVTQHTLGLEYTNEPGGLNESLSDVFGTMFRQWSAGQTADQADWLVGKEIVGPKAQALGYTCLRDLADPGATHCLGSQPAHYSDYRPGMDPHESSGIPNHAFYLAATKLGGHSWEKIGRIWYAVVASGRSPRMTMKRFAATTRKFAGSMFTAEPNVATAVDAAWAEVGL